MKKYSARNIFATFFLFLITTLNLVSSNEIQAIESNSINDIEFQSKGVKIEFSEEKNEFETIKNKLLKLDNEEFDISQSDKDEVLSMSAINSNYDITLIQWCESDNKYNYSITIVNEDKNKKLEDLNKEIRRLGFIGKENLRYFQEIKGKIKRENYNENDLKLIFNGLKIVDNEYLPIKNGICGKVTFNNGRKLTYSMNDYESGKYFIVGTPMIFSTY